VKELATLSGLNLNDRLNKVKRLIEIKEMEKEPFNLGGLIITSEAGLTEKLTDIGLGSSEFRFLRSLAESRDLEDALSSDRLSREDALKLLYFLNSVGFAEIKIKEPESDKHHSFDMEGLSQES
jgi:hypothetical protein